MPTHHIRIRRFLNRPGHHAGAYVIASVADSSSCRRADCDHYFCAEMDLRISDCDRSLDFAVNDAAARRNSLYKINTLIDTLEAFREALIIEADRAAANKRPRRRHRPIDDLLR